MWAIKNHTRYKVGRTWGRDKEGVHQWIVAVKGTFDIKSDGSTTLAKEQLDPLLMAEYHGEPGMSSLRYDADFVAPKPTTDVVLNGTAHAPNGQASADFLVGFRVGQVNKVIRVLGNRQWKEGLFGLKPSAMEPVTKLPITYERAYGGYDRTDPDPKKQRMDSRNPVGCGVVAKSDHRLGQPLPNFEYPQGAVEKSGPAGFGALESHWSPRRELTGTYGEAWQKRRFPLLPDDWDPRCLLCSPADQRPHTHMRGGEPVELVNLTPDGKLRFALPSVHLQFSTQIDKRTEEHQGQLATVIVEPDHPRVIMVWQSVLAVRNDGDYLDETVVTEEE